MDLKVRFWILSIALVGSLILSACGSNSGTGSQGGGNAGGTGGGGGTGGEAVTLNITTPGEQLRYEPATLTAKSGSQVTVEFKNGSTVQKHNWVLVKGGDDVAGKIDEEGVTAGEAKGYIPDDKANLIANTPLLNGGASGNAQFTAPAPGTYTFLCTFPGHYAAGMKGTLTVN